MNDRLTSSTLKTSAWLEPHARLGISLMDHLFNRLDGAYPNKWRASFKTEQAISNWRESWAEAFDEEGITTQMISDGIRRCRKLFDWPPSLTEFLKACKPPIDIDAAVYEAIAQMRARQEARDVWSDPAIFWAAARVGEFDMLSQTFAQLKPRFESELRKVLETVVQPVPARVPMLAAPSKSESTREYGRQKLEELGASALVRNPSKGGNIKWAEKIVAEHKETGKVDQNKLRIAKEAIFNVTGKHV